jgi:hypothetical protein
MIFQQAGTLSEPVSRVVRLSAIGEPRRDLFGEDVHPAQLGVQAKAVLFNTLGCWSHAVCLN